MTHHSHKVGDQIPWTTEAGHVTGRIVKAHIQAADDIGHRRRTSPDELPHKIVGEKKNEAAMHKGSALRMIE